MVNASKSTFEPPPEPWESSTADPRHGSILTQPNMYARGILFGKMKYELGDHSFVRCPELGLSADVEFKTKGYFGGTYNAIGGTIKNDLTGELLFELSGMWSGEMFIKDLKVQDPAFDQQLDNPNACLLDGTERVAVRRLESETNTSLRPTS